MYSTSTLKSLLRIFFHSMPDLTTLSMYGTTSLFVFPALGYGLGETTDPMQPKLRELLFIRTNINDVLHS